VDVQKLIIAIDKKISGARLPNYCASDKGHGLGAS
jgi:hypothetical protein